MPAQSVEYVHTTFQMALSVRERVAGIRPASDLNTEQDRANQYQRLRNLVYTIVPLIGLRQPNNSLVLLSYQSLRPSGSHYDPTYIETLSALEQRDKVINPGDDLYEVTSGSAGTSFAWICSRLGFNAHIYVPASLPQARIQEMINFGAQVEIVGNETSYVPDASRAETRAFIRDAKSSGHQIQDPIQNDEFNLYYARNPEGHTMVLVNHSENGLTPKTMEDILFQTYAVTPKGTKIDHIVSIIGNGSSSTGLYTAKAKYFPEAELIGVEGYDSAVLFREKYPELAENWGLVYKPQRMYGSIIPGMKLPFVDAGMFDEIRLVKERQMQLKMDLHNFERPVIEWIGMSSSASLIVAEQLAAENPGSITFAIVYDGGYRYNQPIIETGEFDETYFPNQYRRIPRRVPWTQTEIDDISKIPTTVAQAINSYLN